MECGGSAILKCSATGVPPPDISWQKDSGSDFPVSFPTAVFLVSIIFLIFKTYFELMQAARERRIRVVPETNTYEILQVVAADMGVYTCTASNPAGSISTNITLSVLEVPR